MGFADVTRKAAGTLATGLVGAVALEAAKKWGGPLLARKSLVTAAAWGLRGVRAAETGAESARLYGADILAEAREQVGETAPPPGSGFADEHAHDH